MNIEYISFKLLCFYRNNHIYVPIYNILTPEEAKDICKYYRCEEKHFPIILSNDPQVLYLGVKKGCFLHNRNNNTYRVVQDSV
jgi:DNA-directed RNA polymerase subunit H (RpoH/RPB5)